MKLLSRVQLLVTPWTAARQAPLPMGFSRQEYWSGVSLPSPKYRGQKGVHLVVLVYHFTHEEVKYKFMRDIDKSRMQMVIAIVITKGKREAKHLVEEV